MGVLLSDNREGGQMPSNDELLKQAQELAEKLEVELDKDFEQKSNKEREEAVKAMRAQFKAKTEQEEAEAKAAAEKAAAENLAESAKDDSAAAAQQAKAEAEAEKAAKAAKKPPFYVAPGKALNCGRKGILSGDTADEVKAEYVGGEKQLNELVKKGYVLKG